MSENISVLQDWLVKIPIRMQSTLILGLRGPDTHNCPRIKEIVRWLRGLAFKPGNPGNVVEFMGTIPPRILEKSPVAKELEFCSQHFYSHLIHSLEVVAYRHPQTEVFDHARLLFEDLCDLMHLYPETQSQFERRLRTLDWPQDQPDNFEEALNQLSQ